MIMFFHGADTFRSYARLRELEDGFVQKYDPGRVNVALLNDKTDPSSVRGLLTTLPFLAKKRLVIARDFFSLPADVAAAVQETVKSGIPETTVFLARAAGGGDKKKHKEIFDLLQGAAGQTEIFSELKGTEAARYAQGLAKKAGCRFAKGALDELMALCQGDWWRIRQEMAKLAAFCPEREAQAGDVRELVSGEEDDNIFSMLDAMAAGKSGHALRYCERQLRIGDTAYSILSMMVWQTRLLLAAKNLLNRDPRAPVAAGLGIKPFVAQKITAQSKRWTEDTLRILYQKLIELDAKMKSGLGDPVALLTVLVASVK